MSLSGTTVTVSNYKNSQKKLLFLNNIFKRTALKKKAGGLSKYSQGTSPVFYHQSSSISPFVFSWDPYGDKTSVGVVLLST